mmetsp:Transcript_19223/g.31548  ORF Transcript_19223/g.31548 Transcript_19223/m.31548 type:complete len:144 (+) Transcript_19223:385-816(+)
MVVYLFTETNCTMEDPHKLKQEITCRGGLNMDDFEIIQHDDMPQDEGTNIKDEQCDMPSSSYPKEDLIKLAEKSKDPTHASELMGCRLELKWSSGKWYRGTICEYNATKRKHKVMYDDGDLRWYYLPEMVFRFVKEEDEWVKC